MAPTTQREIDGLARRIRHAYRARGMHWNDGCSTARVWTAAALVLLQIHDEHPEIPMDPELFVASQALDTGVVDAWSLVGIGTGPSAIALSTMAPRSRAIALQLATGVTATDG